MVRSTGLATIVALVALTLGNGAQAQTVHKCIVNGAAVYQAGACPAANEEKSLVIPPPPSQQELLDATANARLQQYQADSGRLASNSQRRYYKAPTSLGPSQQMPERAPANACERLNQSYHENQYRREELLGAGAKAARPDALQRVNDELKRTQEEANVTHCQLR